MQEKRNVIARLINEYDEKILRGEFSRDSKALTTYILEAMYKPEEENGDVKITDRLPPRAFESEG